MNCPRCDGPLGRCDCEPFGGCVGNPFNVQHTARHEEKIMNVDLRGVAARPPEPDVEERVRADGSPLRVVTVNVKGTLRTPTRMTPKPNYVNTRHQRSVSNYKAWNRFNNDLRMDYSDWGDFD